MFKKFIRNSIVAAIVFSICIVGQCLAGPVQSKSYPMQRMVCNGKPYDSQMKHVLMKHFLENLGQSIRIATRTDEEYGKNGVVHDPDASDVNIVEGKLAVPFLVYVNDELKLDSDIVTDITKTVSDNLGERIVVKMKRVNPEKPSEQQQETIITIDEVK